MTPWAPPVGQGPDRERRVFPSRTESVRGARQWVGAKVADIGPEARDTVGLLVSELAANAVQHGGTPFTVEVDWFDDRVRVAVTDEGGGRPQLQDQDPRAASGRGLRLVDGLSAAWGIREGRPSSTTVWFTVAARP